MEKKSRSTNNSSSLPVSTQRLLAVLILVALCVFVIFLVGGQNRIKDVVIRRDGNVDASITDEAIIRASGIKMGAQIGSIGEMEESIENGVNALGTVQFKYATKTSRNTVEIGVSGRIPVAVVDSSGNYILLDMNGVVMEVLGKLPTADVLYVTGAEIKSQDKGKQLVTKKPEQLESILRIAKAVKNGGFEAIYSELNVKDIKDMRLVTNTSLIVEIYDGKDIEKALLLAKGVIDEGKTTGKVIISGDNAAYRSTEGS